MEVREEGGSETRDKRLSNKIKTHKQHLISHIKSDLHFSDMLYLLHIMCGYQCDKAVTKNDDPVK